MKPLPEILHETANLYLVRTHDGLQVHLMGATAPVVIGTPKDIVAAKRVMERLERYPRKLREMYAVY